MLLGLMWMMMASFRGSLFMVFSVSERYKKGLPCNNGLLLFGWWFFLQYKKGGVHVCVCLFNPMQRFEKTTPCKGLFEKQSHAIPFQAAFSNRAAIFLYSGASLSSSMK